MISKNRAILLTKVLTIYFVFHTSGVLGEIVKSSILNNSADAESMEGILESASLE